MFVTFHRVPLLMLFASIAPAVAEQSGELAVNTEQIAALGITTTAVAPVSRIALGIVPGRIVIPPSAQRIVTAPFDGVVADVVVHEGQQVKTGAMLASIRSRVAAEAYAESLRLSANAEVARAQAQREKRLVQEGIAPARRAEESAAQARAAQAAADAARAVLRGVRPSSARGDEFELLAPAAGIVQERGLAVGAEVRADAVGFVIVTNTERWVEAQAPESLLGSLSVGDHVELTGARGDAQSGRVVAIGNQIDPSTRNAMLRAAFPEGVRMLAGSVAELKVFHDATVPTFEIPSVAVVRHEGTDVVFVRTTGGFRTVSVECGARLNGRVAVQGELSASDEVAVSGVSALKAMAQQS